MGRPKKNTERSHVDIHNYIAQTSFKQINSACSDYELRNSLLITINGYLQHIDCCLSELTDLEHEREARYKSITTKGGKANAKSASRADDAREV